MMKVRIGFLTRAFSPETRSSVPLVMRALVEAGAIVDVVHPLVGPTDLAGLRIQHDLYVLKQMSGLAVSLAGVLHAQGAAIVNPYPVTLALSDKIVTFRVLQRAGVPLPDTYVFSDPITVAPLLETGPLIVKPVRGWDGHGVRIISKASELADLPARKEPMFAQRYIPPEGHELKMFAIGGRAFGVDLYGVDIIERGGIPYVVDMNSIPGFKGVPDAPLRVARYLYTAALRAARGEPVFESAVQRELAGTAERT